MCLFDKLTSKSLTLSSLKCIFGVVRLIKTFQRLDIKPSEPKKSSKAEAKLRHELLTDIEIKSMVFNKRCSRQNTRSTTK